MKKNMCILSLALLIMGCSGYLDDQQSSGTLMNTLAIENGGGYLSGPSNDITPFLYRDTNGNNPVLFFSSDRDGTYDIYYAVMNDNGTFQAPIKMGFPINTDVSNEYSPVVGYWFDSYDVTNSYPSTNLRMSYVRDFGSNHRIYSCKLLNNFVPYAISFNTSTFYITALSLRGDTIYKKIWIIGGLNNTNGGGSFSTGNWSAFQYTKFEITGVYSAIEKTISNANDVIQQRVLEVNGGLSQLAYSVHITNLTTLEYVNEFRFIDTYKSGYNDRWPFVDFGGNGQVYFSSDRGVNGDYDLFRYNDVGFYQVMPKNPFN